MAMSAAEEKVAIVLVSWPVMFAHRLASEVGIWSRKNGYNRIEIIDFSSAYFLMRNLLPAVAIPSNRLRWLTKVAIHRLMRFRILRKYKISNERVIFSRNDLKSSENSAKISTKELDFIIMSNLNDPSVGQFDDTRISELRGVLLSIYHRIENYLSRRQSVPMGVTTHWFLFNGRFPVESLLSHVLRSQGAKLRFFEVGPRENSFEIYGDSPFSHHERKSLIDASSLLADSKETSASTLKFLEVKKRGKDHATIFWSHGQDAFPTRQQLAGDREVITFFASTEGELASLDFGDKGPLFPNQTLAVEWLISMIDFSKFVLIIREHPRHLLKQRSSSLKHLAELDASNVSYIPSDSPINSRHLIRESALCVVYDSTIGVDVILWNRPLLMLGRPMFAVNFQRSQTLSEIEKNFDNFSNFVYSVDCLLGWANYSLYGGHDFQS